MPTCLKKRITAALDVKFEILDVSHWQADARVDEASVYLIRISL